MINRIMTTTFFMVMMMRMTCASSVHLNSLLNDAVACSFDYRLPSAVVVRAGRVVLEGKCPPRFPDKAIAPTMERSDTRLRRKKLRFR